MQRDALSPWLRLQSTSGVGVVRAAALLAAFGSPEGIFGASVGQLSQCVPNGVALALQSTPASFPDLLDRCEAWHLANPQHHRIWSLQSASYPPALRHIPDPPLLLFAQLPASESRANWLCNPLSRCVAVVGSRNPTPQGEVNGAQLAGALTKAGATIVSGMALGIDASAHRGALSVAASANPSQALTVAVVGTGLDRVYPSVHRDLAHQICDYGLLLSEYPPGTAPLASHFPQRNRIISGLSLGTLVIEAALQSGSLITAQLAIDEGKEVFAVPGSIHSAQSKGCHALIRQGAKLTECAQDVLEELAFAPEGFAKGPVTQPSGAPDRGAEHNNAVLLNALGFDPADLDTLAERTQLATPDLLSALMTLELQGEAVRLPGGRFARLVQH